MSMKVAAGFIVYRRVDNLIDYLLLQTSYGLKHWSPPKGHLDPGETEMQAAIRETQEEAGLQTEHYVIDPEFKEVLQYPVNGKMKTVYYWLAELKNLNQEIKLSDEHIAYNWGDIETTKKLSKFDDMNKALDQAHVFLMRKNKS